MYVSNKKAFRFHDQPSSAALEHLTSSAEARKDVICFSCVVSACGRAEVGVGRSVLLGFAICGTF